MFIPSKSLFLLHTHTNTNTLIVRGKPRPHKESKVNMKKINLILRKCKTLSRQLSRSSSYSSLRSKSSRNNQELWDHDGDAHADIIHNNEPRETIFVGSSKRRYVICSKYLSHPLLNTLIDKSKADGDYNNILIKCEVVLFDHLLWMLENVDPNLNSDSLEELADLYMF